MTQDIIAPLLQAALMLYDEADQRRTGHMLLLGYSQQPTTLNDTDIC